MKSICRQSKQDRKPAHLRNIRSPHDIHSERSAGQPAAIKLQRIVGNQAVRRLIARGDIGPDSSRGQIIQLRNRVDLSRKSVLQKREEREESGLPETLNAASVEPMSGSPMQSRQSEESGAGISSESPEAGTVSPISQAEPQSATLPETSPQAEEQSETVSSSQTDQEEEATQASGDADKRAEAEGMTEGGHSQVEQASDVKSPTGVAGDRSAGEDTIVPQESGPQSGNSSQSRQDNPLEGHTTNQTQRLVEDVTGIIKQVMRKSVAQSGAVPNVQRGILGRIGGAISRGIGWIRRNVVEPIRRIISTGAQAVTEFGRRFAAAYAQSDAPEWDVQRRAFQALASVRNQLYGQTIARQRAQRAQAVQEGRITPAQAAEPTALERIDAAADAFESGVDTVLGVQSEIVEGAVIGDFKENPTIWNTVGQIAIGFVPYAGQVADVRDLVASIRKLYKGGWRDPLEWVNLVLVGIGFIPGLGDLVKAGGRGAIRFLREAGPAILRRGRRIWQRVARRVPQLIDGARQFGRRLLDSAASAGRRLLNGARGLARRAMNAARRVGSSIRSAISRTRSAISNIGRAIRQRASSAVSRARGLLGRIGRAVSGAARRAYQGARGLVTRARNLAQRGIARGRELIAGLRRRATDMANRARRFVTETLPAAARRARDMLVRARQRMVEAVRRRIAQGRRMLSSAYRGARDFVVRGVRGLKERAIRFFQERIRPLPGRIRDFLADRWQRLKERLGYRRPEEPIDRGLAGRGHRPAPGERSMTREQYEQYRRQQRAGRNVTELDQPLPGTYHHGPQAGQPRHGHTARSHRAAKTNRQLRERAMSSNIHAATRFADNATHLRVVNTMRGEAMAELARHTPGSNVTTTLANGATFRVMQNGRRISVTGRRFPGTNIGTGCYGNRAAADGILPAGRSVGDPTGPLEHATLVLERTGFNSAGRPIYEIVTAFPALP